MRISPGSASPGRRRCGGSRSISPTIAPRSRKLAAQGLIYPSFREPRRDRASGCASARRPEHGRAIPTARRFIRARQNRCRRMSASGGSGRARLTRCGSTWRRPARGPANLAWTEHGEGPAGETGDVTAQPEAWGDVILARKETPTSYHLSVVIDDALQGVTDVVRGQDLFWSTSVHRLLQELLGLSEPAYRHHRLVLDAAGHKLSKSSGATGLRELRAAGATAGRYSPPGWIAVVLRLVSRKRRRDSRGPGMPFWRPGGVHGNHGGKIARTAHLAARRQAAAEKACFKASRQKRAARGARRDRGEPRHGRGGAGGVCT